MTPPQEILGLQAFLRPAMPAVICLFLACHGTVGAATDGASIGGSGGGGAGADGGVDRVASSGAVGGATAGGVAGGTDLSASGGGAGVGGGGLSWETPLSTWEWVLGVNLWGVIHGVRSFVPLLIQQSEAHIVNTASVAGLMAAPFMGPYNASKHAVVAIAETLHHELAMTAPHVKVSVLCPGWVNTNIADSARNRPPRLQEGVGVADPDAAQLLRGFIEQGMPPDDVAGKVVDAIRTEQFWILTHDGEGDFWVDGVSGRLRSLEARTNPRLGLPL